MSVLVLLRHGESLWNKENRFTGWVDVDLSPFGERQSIKAGELMRKQGLVFDYCYTSYLKRAIKTLNFCLDKMDLLYLPVKKDWRLNERHYGALQGLNKLEMVGKYGEKQVNLWRRSYSVRPPAILPRSKYSQSFEERYENIRVPLTESLKDVYRRVVPFWSEQIAPKLKKNMSILIVAHGNSLRALVKYLEKIDDQKISELNIPTGFPLVYQLDKKQKILSKKFLGNSKQIQSLIEKIKHQSMA